MRRSVVFIGLVVVLFMNLARAQNSPSPDNSRRRVTFRVSPDYPELAKKMHLQGVVKVETVVRPNGSVKSTRVLGGNPVLVEAATEAVGKWKFEPEPNETIEVVQLIFAPQ